MRGQKFFPLVVIAAGLLAYHNSFTGVFFQDDVGEILQNPTIRHVWPIWQSLSPPPHRNRLVRPLINLSFAISYALSGYNVWGYHALNLTVHILAGLTLLGIVRRTLLTPTLVSGFGATANELALATAVLWTVHPLQTESVTYITQRFESIMGLFYLLTLYCFIRGVESRVPRIWYSLSVTACALGMASKEVMVSAPLMVMLYDRAFVSATFREAWRQRWPLYLALSAAWILLAFVQVAGHNVATALMNAQTIHLTWWEYLATQPEVILYYLRLSFWPHPLCLNYSWPVAKTWMTILPPTVAVVGLLGASAWAWKKCPAWGFVGAWFFLILAISSSFIPLYDLIYEHRMYLSLAAVVSLVVMGLYSLAGRYSLAVFLAMAIGLGFLTWRRNQDYRSEVTFWRDAAVNFPNDPRMHYNLGIGLEKAGKLQEAIEQYEETLRLNPNVAGAHYHLGLVLTRVGRVQEAIEHSERVVQLMPDLAEAYNSLGIALGRVGRDQEAVNQFEHALRIKPDHAEAHNNLGNALARLGREQEAMGHWEQALRLRPDLAEAHYNLGIVLEQTGQRPEAIGHYEQALRIEPDYAEARERLGRLRVTQ